MYSDEEKDKRGPVLLGKEYRSFLDQRQIAKPVESMNHDITLLDTVHRLRSQAPSSLDAHALLITCDYLLYQFDWENSRRQQWPACSVLPNLFWQIIRPFIPNDADFDVSFVQTFAIPEFRSVKSDTSKACSKLICLLSAYEDIPESTATELVCNSLLLDRLKNVKETEKFHEIVDKAIVHQNQELLQEKAALDQQISHLKAEWGERERRLNIEKGQIQHELTKTQSQFDELQEQMAVLSKKVEAAEAATNQGTSRKDISARGAENGGEEPTTLSRWLLFYQAVSGAAMSVLSVTAFEWSIRFWNWDWLLRHANRYGLEIGADILIVLFLLGLFVTRYRKWIWGAGVFPVLAVLVSLLGGSGTGSGPTPKP